MLSTLEGVLIALMVAFSPADGASEGGPMAAAVAADPAAACGRYSSETARRNCVVRLGRPLETADAANKFPEQLSWVAPNDPGMPDRFMMRRPH